MKTKINNTEIDCIELQRGIRNKFYIESKGDINLLIENYKKRVFNNKFFLELQKRKKSVKSA